MQKQYIEFVINHQKIVRTDDFFVVGGTKNYLHARIKVCDDWQGEEVVAVFTTGNISKKMPVVDGECCVPWEVLQPGIRKFYVGCFAGSRITSNAALVEVNPCGVCDAENGLAPTPDIYDQILAAANEAVAVANSVREDADNGVFDGPPGPPGDGTNSDLQVKVTIGQDGKLVADHTIQEIKAAHRSRWTVSAVYEDTENDVMCVMPLTMISESTVTFDLITDISTFTVLRLRIQDDSVHITRESADMQYLLNGGIDPYVHHNYVKKMIEDAISALPDGDEVSY